MVNGLISQIIPEYDPDSEDLSRRIELARDVDNPEDAKEARALELENKESFLLFLEIRNAYGGAFEKLPGVRGALLALNTQGWESANFSIPVGVLFTENGRYLIRFGTEPIIPESLTVEDKEALVVQIQEKEKAANNFS